MSYNLQLVASRYSISCGCSSSGECVSVAWFQEPATRTARTSEVGGGGEETLKQNSGPVCEYLVQEEQSLLLSSCLERVQTPGH